MEIHRRLIHCLLLLALPVLCAEQGKPEEPKEEIWVAQPADLQVSTESEALLEPSRRKRLRIAPEEYMGPYTIAEIAPGGQMVEEGKVVLKLDTSNIERLIRGAQESLDAVRARANTAREEYENLKAANRQKLDRMAYDVTLAVREQKIFDKYAEEYMLHTREMAVKSQEFSTGNQQEELNQLEKMYKDTQLAGDTKEIVLERARRSLALAKDSLETARKNEKQVKEFDHPSRKEWLKLNLEQKTQDLDLYRTTVRLAEFQKNEDLKANDRAVRDAQERLARLEGDLKQMTWTAPFTGMMSYRGWEVDDKVMPNTVVAEILDMKSFDAKFQLTQRELQAIKVGDKAQLHSYDFPGVVYEATIEDISLIPNTDDKGVVRYGVRARLADSKNLRSGIKAHVDITGPMLEKVISLPRSAITYDDGRSFCRVRKDDKIDKREIVTGPGNSERVQIIKGLSEGETVIIKDGKAK